MFPWTAKSKIFQFVVLTAVCCQINLLYATDRSRLRFYGRILYFALITTLEQSRQPNLNCKLNKAEIGFRLPR